MIEKGRQIEEDTGFAFTYEVLKVRPVEWFHIIWIIETVTKKSLLGDV